LHPAGIPTHPGAAGSARRWLWLFGGPAVVALFIWDATEKPPLPRDAADDDESGRGLTIVGKLSAEWGFYYPAGPGGKVTWAIIDTP
jgi:hypothetical protein